MDTETAIEDILKENEVLKKWKVEDCKVFPNLGSNIYICPPCQIYKCENHFWQYRNCKWGHSLCLDSMIDDGSFF